MAGLEKITAAILENAEAEAARIVSEAETKARRISEEAAKAAAETKNAALQKAENEAKIILDNAESSGVLDKKNKLLSAKIELIESVLQKTLETLCALPADTYFTVIGKLIQKGALNGEGQLILSDADKSRISAGFLDSLTLPSGRKIVLSKQTDNTIGGGCVLQYGDIAINCSFAAILSENHERLVDIVNKKLFA